MNETALFRNQWQYRPEAGEDDDAFKFRIRPQLRGLLAEAKASGVLVPQVVYGYWPVNSDGNDLVVWTDESRSVEATRFAFPRQRVEPWLCIADFFRSIDSGEADYAAFHIVTMGAAVSEATAALFAENRYQEYLLLHGLGVEMAEALAERGTGASARSGASPARTAPRSAGCSASSTAAAATRGATRRARTSRTTPRWPGCSAPSASASRSARRPAGSTSPSRPRRPSSATTRRPSTSSPVGRARQPKPRYGASGPRGTRSAPTCTR